MKLITLIAALIVRDSSINVSCNSTYLSFLDERSKLIQSPLASNNKNEIGATSFSRIGYDDDHDDSEEFDTSEGVSKSNILSFGGEK